MYSLFFKRIIDLCFCLVGLPVFCMAFVILAPIIFLTDKGPVFYNAMRIGRNGHLFKMFKFRSMVVNAPDIRLKDGSTFNGEDDPRVTKIGHFLRRTSLDELPQFINVLLGDMSLVGPRPDPPDWLDKYPEDIRVFLTVRPGITGYSQAYFRNGCDGYDKMKNDAFYAKNCSFIMDMKIILRTIRTVLFHENIDKDNSMENNQVDESELQKLNG